MKRFLIIHVMPGGSEERYEITARNYRTAWRNRAEHAMHLEDTRCIVIHEIHEPAEATP
jgi:hypothetical protein